MTGVAAPIPCPLNDGGLLEDDSYLFPSGRGCDVCGKEFRLIGATWKEVAS